jgi:hypothetical protein
MALVLAFGAGLGYRWASYFSYNEIKTDGTLFWLLYAIPMAGIGLSALMFLRGWVMQVPDPAVRLAGTLNERWQRVRRRTARRQLNEA